VAEQADIDVIAAIVCDDVRKEINGKDILVGVYSGGILLNRTPAELGLSFWFLYRPRNTGSAKVELRVSTSEKPNSGEAVVELEVLQMQDGSFFTPPLGFTFTKPETITGECRIGDGDWRPLITMPVGFVSGPKVSWPAPRPGGTATAQS